MTLVVTHFHESNPPEMKSSGGLFLGDFPYVKPGIYMGFIGDVPVIYVFICIYMYLYVFIGDL